MLGLVLALAIPLLTSRLRVPGVRVRRPGRRRFILTVGYDVLVSRLRRWPGTRRMAWRLRPRAGFVTIPLELRDPVGLSGLCMVATVVPGTVWV